MRRKIETGGGEEMSMELGEFGGEQGDDQCVGSLSGRRVTG